MIRVIDGKRYNTETAEQVVYWDNGHYAGDFKLRQKTLYRTAKGNWFIHHVGGALTDMAVTVGSNGYGGSSDIEPLTDQDAFAFLESRSDQDDAREAIEKYFADQVEDA